MPRESSRRPSIILWKSNTKCARSEMKNLPVMSTLFSSRVLSSRNRVGRWMTQPLPTMQTFCGWRMPEGIRWKANFLGLSGFSGLGR